MKRILVTNDDGINAEGLKVLRETLSLKWEVLVVAPDREQSAVSHALTLHQPLRVSKVDGSAYSVEGTPTDCVMLAICEFFKDEIDLVVSGINHGSNLGDDVTYSGTVAAAIEGTLLGIPSVAVSLVWKNGEHLRAASDFVTRIVEKLFAEDMPEDTFLNVNIPDIPPDEIKGVRVTKLGRRLYRDPIEKGSDPRGKPYYWIGGQVSTWSGGEDTDFEAVGKAYISVSPLHLDLTNYKAMGELRSWNFEEW